jgi:signal transduction histidine kinase/CheY-like chemotaxis protein
MSLSNKLVQDRGENHWVAISPMKTGVYLVFLFLLGEKCLFFVQNAFSDTASNALGQSLAALNPVLCVVLSLRAEKLLFVVAALALLLAAGLAFTLFKYIRRMRKLEEKNRLIQQQEEQLRVLDSAKTQFFTNVSHEFRTPLMIILGLAEQLHSSAGVSQSNAHNKDREAIAMIQRNGESLLRLINQLLDLSKMDSGLLKANWQQGNVMAYLQYLTESFHSMAQERNIRLVFYPETECLLMDYEAGKLQAIVSNLLSNALKFTGRGGIVVMHAKTVSSVAAPRNRPNTADERPQSLQIIVQDTGKGIPTSELPHIFDRFYQVEDRSTRRGEGTGIGLAYVKELMHLLGGSIAVESTEGKGTTFTLLLPITQNAPGVQTPHQAPGAPLPAFDTRHPMSNTPDTTSITPHRTSPTLLIIEDNPDVAAYLRNLLENDYQIAWANDGRAGIDKAIDLIPDIIISDVMMPEKDGYEVCYTLKNDERTSHIPIILLTAKATRADKLTGLRTGADAYLEKPFDREELFVHLEKLVGLRVALQGRYKDANADTAGVVRLSTATQVEIPATAAPALDDLFLQKLREIITQKISDPRLDIAFLCQTLQLSNTQLLRKLKALTGQTPVQYIRSTRLAKAKELLKTSHLNISEIAYETGFNDPNYFSRMFFEEFEETPVSVRRNARQNVRRIDN